MMEQSCDLKRNAGNENANEMGSASEKTTQCRDLPVLQISEWI